MENLDIIKNKEEKIRKDKEKLRLLRNKVRNKKVNLASRMIQKLKISDHLSEKEIQGAIIEIFDNCQNKKKKELWSNLYESHYEKSAQTDTVITFIFEEYKSKDEKYNKFRKSLIDLGLKWNQYIKIWYGPQSMKEELLELISEHNIEKYEISER